MYKINYYSADGRIGTVVPSPGGMTFATLEEAKAQVIREHGYHGEWQNEDRNVCLHESAVEGCGGFEIATQEAAR